MPPRASRTTRMTAASRAAAPTFDVPDEGPDSSLRTNISAIFRDAQKTTASHRKLVVNLRKIHESCCYEPTFKPTSKPSKGGKNQPEPVSEEFDERDFNHEFTRCVLRSMPVKKSESVGDKTIRFVGLFLRHANDKDNEMLGDEDADSSTMPETPSTRLTTQLMESILPLLMAKDKLSRFRSTQLISHIINSLDAIDDDLFQKLRQGLLKRIRDKEAMVRAQAVLGLGRLAGNQVEGMANSDESDDDDAGNGGLLEKLLEVLQNDPSADVRRSLLVNLPILPNTLPYLLERARDQDAQTRRAVYSRLLPALGDFRHLSLSMREKLLRWGLRDRDENVRKAAGRLFRERWIEDCVGLGEEQTAEGERQPVEAAPVSFDGLLELLERIDVVNSGVENGVALEAMKGFWEGRPDYREAVTFDDQFWETLSAESVFMARSFNEFCRTEGNRKYESLVEEKLPEVTKLAFFLERYLNVLIEAIRRVNNQEGLEDDEEEEDTVEQEFIVEQLLHIALTLDYSDEVGRRKMFALLRQSLSIAELPDEVTKLTVEVLRDLCAPDNAGEKEFCSVVLESVADIHDTLIDEEDNIRDDESFHSAQSQVSRESTPTAFGQKKRGNKDSELNEEEARDKAIKEIMINMKCLHVVQCMLTSVEGNLQQNDHLVAMLNNLVVPAVRSHEAPVRERGLVCLGLCALLDRPLAEENLTLFMHFYSKGHAALQITAIHILTDILNVHGAQLLSANPTLLKVYVKALRSGTRHPEVQGAAVVAVSKLLLGRVVTDQDTSGELLKTLIVAYFDPATAENQGVRQALNYFLPVFCFSRSENQDLMRSVALDALHTLYNVREGLDDDDVDVDEEMASLNSIGSMFVDWTDPRKCFVAGMDMDADKRNVNGDVHLEFARDILEKLDSNFSKEEKKTIAPLLGKLYISPGSSEDKIRELYAEVNDAVDDNLLTDATGRNALYKLHVSLGKIVNSYTEREATTDKGSVITGRSRTTMSRSVSAAPSQGGGGVAASVNGQDGDDDDDDGEATVVAVKMEHASTILEDDGEAVTDADGDEVVDEVEAEDTDVDAMSIVSSSRRGSVVDDMLTDEGEMGA